VIDHHDARIYRSELHGAIPQAPNLQPSTLNQA